MARSSSDSSDDERKTVRIGPAPPVPKKTNATKSSTIEKRKRQCCLLIRKKWFIVGMSAFILLLILAIVLGVTLGGKKPVVYTTPVNLTWWQNSTIYRCYVTSYVDSDGDGIGDFKGSFRYENWNHYSLRNVCLNIESDYNVSRNPGTLKLSERTWSRRFMVVTYPKYGIYCEFFFTD